MSIYQTIRQEVDDFLYNDIEVVSGYSFNQYQTLKRIHLYLNSQFEDNSLFNNREKIFFNITTPKKDVVARFLDVDTKDIRIEERNSSNELPIFFLNYELQNWLAKHNFSKTLNDLADEVVSYGSVVLKTRPNKAPEIVDLRNLFLDPTVDYIKQSRFVILKHKLTHQELRDKVKLGWDSNAIEAIIGRKTKNGDAGTSYERDGMVNQIVSSEYIDVYERYGYVPEKELYGGKSEKDVMSVFIVAEPHLVDEKGNSEGEILFKSSWKKDLPFVDFHFNKTRGRWLGIGVPESLFPAQERINELANQKRISMELSTLHLFQTADPTSLNNILTDLENGAVIRTKTAGAISPIVNEERNLAAFQSEETSYNSLADRISFASDVLSGGDIPSSTPATTVVLQNNNATKVHLQKRENFCIFLRYYLREFELPRLMKEISQRHVLKIVADPSDLAGLDEKIARVKLTEEVWNQALKGNPMTQEDAMAFMQQTLITLQKQGGKRYVEVLEGYYKVNQDDFDINIDGEQKDLTKFVNNSFKMYVDYANDPEMLNDPVKKTLMIEYARALGLDTAKLEVAFAKRSQMMAQGQMGEGGKAKGGEQGATQQSNPEEELATVL